MPLAAPRAVTAVASLRCPAAASGEALAAAIGAQLPAGLAVLAAAEVRPSFGAVRSLERQRYEYLLPVSALLAGPPEDEEAAEPEAEASGRLAALRSDGFGFPDSNWLPTSATAAHSSDAGGDELTAGGCGESKRPARELLRLLGRFRRLKKLLRKFEGRHNFHNLSPTLDADDTARAERTLLHCRCRGTLPGSGEVGEAGEFAVISICARSLLPGMLAGIVGAAVAVATGRLPERYLDCALSPACRLPIPAAPSGGGYLAETAYDIYESKTGTQLRLRPSSYAGGWAATPAALESLAAARSAVQAAAGRDAAAGWGEWVRELEAGLPAMREALAWADAAEAEGGAAQAAAAQVLRAVAPEPVANLPPAPACYETVLGLLRGIDRGGQWPATGLARLRKIEATAAVGEGSGGAVTKGDSFCLGRMPPPLEQPAANNKKFSDLLSACLELEATLRPQRPRSTTLAINRHAQFRPHKDSGGGHGQSLSMIAALGDFSGGELIVEGEQHPIRYEALEFDGWKQMHWTAPFVGERYSVVWFTPRGCAEEEQ